MSIFHCYPREVLELEDFMIGEEMDARLKSKAVSAKTIEGYFESKPGIAMTANDFTRQVKNFWKYNIFMFSEDSWLSGKMERIYKIIRDKEDEIKSIERMNDGFILALAGLINSEYHHFLTSCVKANDDIEKVNWSIMESLIIDIKTHIRKRAIPNFTMNVAIKAIAEQSKTEYKRKLEKAVGEIHTGLTPPRNKLRQQQYQQGRIGGPKRDEPDDDEDRDANLRTNPNVNKNWKMSVKKFKEIINPNISKMPKIGNKSICAMYNIVGRCAFGAQCRHTHEELTGNVKTEFEKWLAACKEQQQGKKSPKDGEKKNGD
jgi:hypothetical protein